MENFRALALISPPLLLLTMMASMEEYSGHYAPRDIEANILAHINHILTDTSIPFSAALLTGPRGFGSASILMRGIAPHLKADPRYSAACISGHWDPDHQIQYCATERDVPTSPPPPENPIRLLLFAATDFGELPAWIMTDGPPEVRTFPVGPLTLMEAQQLIEAQLGDSMELASMQKLATLSGFVPAMLSSLIRECSDQGGLEYINGSWRILGDPIQIAVFPYLQAQLAAATPQESGALFRIALAEPVLLSQLSTDDAAIATRLLRDGELQRQMGSTLCFTSPAIGEALRLLSPPEEREKIHRQVLQSGELTLAAIRWAAQRGVFIAAPRLEQAAADALKQHDWAAVTAIAAACEALQQAEWNDAAATAICTTHLHAAYAARFLPDTELAHAHLDRATELLPLIEPDHVGLARAHIMITTAELLHYHQGKLDKALEALDPESVPDQHKHLLSQREELLSHRVLHLVYGGRTHQAQQIISNHKATLRRASPQLRTRVMAAETLALTATGKPQHALRMITQLTSQAGMPESAAWMTEELRTAGIVAALSSDGPAAFPALQKYLGDTRDGTYQPDLITFYLARASWEFAAGNIAYAHRLGELALESSWHLDTSGVGAALIALTAQTSALLGDHKRALHLCKEFANHAPKSAAIIAGGMYGNIAGAQLLLQMPHTGPAMREIAEEFIAHEQFGFASDALYSGVRFGRRRAAQSLQNLAPTLDGTLHSMRLAHATALLDSDAVALLAVSARLTKAGLNLYAAEAAAAAARVPGAPAAVVSRAVEKVTAYLQDNPVPGHQLLLRVVSMSVADSKGLTPREREIAALIEAGLTNREIAARLTLSTRTIEGHVTRIYRKTNLARRLPGRSRALPKL